jgi:hypothetical protein
MLRQLLLALLLLVGSYEAARQWISCLSIGWSTDVFFICSVQTFDFHHAAALVLLAASVVLFADAGRHRAK